MANFFNPIREQKALEFRVIQEDGTSRAVTPLEYVEAPACRRVKFMDQIRELRRQREEREAKRQIELHDELELNAEAGLKLRRPE